MSAGGPERNAACAVAQKEKDQLALAQYGDNLSCDRPDPNDPGGLGAEESGTERTGPTQTFLFAMQDGGRWAEVGRYYDSANDPVTAGIGRFAAFRAVQAAKEPLRTASVSAIMSWT